jgi:hypothetical protein
MIVSNIVSENKTNNMAVVMAICNKDSDIIINHA